MKFGFFPENSFVLRWNDIEDQYRGDDSDSYFDHANRSSRHHIESHNGNGPVSPAVEISRFIVMN